MLDITGDIVVHVQQHMYILNLHIKKKDVGI